MRKQWELSERKFLAENFNRLSYGEIGKRLGRSYDSVSEAANKFGLSGSKVQPYQKFFLTKEELGKMYNFPMTYYEIAEKLNVSSSLIGLKMKQWGIKSRSPSLRKTRMWNPIISKDLCYVLGVILGDGSVSYHPEYGQYHVRLTVIDENFARSFFSSLMVIGLKPKITFYKNKWWIAYACSKMFAKWYKGLSLNDIENFLNDKNNVSYFIRGFFDSEGNVTKRQLQVTMFNSNLELINMIKRLLDKYLNLKVSIRNIGRSEWSKKDRYSLYILGGKQSSLTFLKTVLPTLKGKEWFCENVDY